MFRQTCLLTFALILGPSTAMADWKAAADPSPEKPVQWPAGVKLDIGTPKSFADPVIVFADRGGPFVAVGVPEFNVTSMAVYDLRTSEKVGDVSVPMRMTTMVLSQDGLILAGYPEDSKKPTFTTFDVVSGRELASVPVEFGGEMVTFVGNDKVAYRSRAGKDRDLHLIEAKTGTELTKFATAITLNVPPVASPGGKFLAMAKQDGIAILSTSDASLVGELTTKVPKPDAKPGAFLGGFSVKGMVFSPDGSLLAAMSDGGDQARILVWSMKDGKLAHDISLEKILFAFFDGPKLEWLPDGSGWLLNASIVVDRETGKIIWTHPLNHTRSPRRAMDTGSIVYLDSTNRDARKLMIATTSKEKIAAIRASLKSGGTAFDAALPKVVVTDFSKAKEVEIPLPGVAWTITLEPGPATPAVARRPIPLTRKGLEIDGLFITSGSKPFAVLDIAKRENAFTAVTETTSRQLEVLDLSTGKVTTTFDLAPGCQVVSVSADGKYALTRDLGTNQRVDVWSSEKQSHVVGWKPYAKEAEAGRKITFAAFAGAMLITMNSTGLLVGWNPANATPVYRATLLGFKSPRVSPSGKHLVGVQQGVVRFLDATTGSAVGDLEPKASGEFTMQGPIGIRSDGQEVAVLLQKATDFETLLVRWDAKGKRLEEVPYPGVSFGTPSLAYVSDDHLLIDNRELYDIKRKAVVWRYAMTGAGKFPSQSPEGRTWYVVPSGFDGPASIVAATLPEDEVIGYVKAVVDGPDAILKPGTKVAIDLEVTGSYADKAKDASLEAVKAQLKINGFVYAPDADLKLKLKVSERKTGEKIEFRKLYSGILDSSPNAKLSVEEIEILTSAELRSEAELLWKQPDQKLRMGEFFGIIRLPDKDTNLTDYLYKQVWDKVPGRTASVGMPRFLAKTPLGVMGLPGNSLLQAGGPTTMKPVVKR